MAFTCGPNLYESGNDAKPYCWAQEEARCGPPSGPQPDYPPIVKFTVIEVSTSTGSPFSM